MRLLAVTECDSACEASRYSFTICSFGYVRNSANSSNKRSVSLFSSTGPPRSMPTTGLGLAFCGGWAHADNAVMLTNHSISLVFIFQPLGKLAASL
jgi:hypothetical protein